MPTTSKTPTYEELASRLAEAERALEALCESQAGTHPKGTGADAASVERAQTGEALPWAHEQLAFVIEGARLGTWAWNTRTNSTVFNEIWAEMIGYRLDELGSYNYETWVSLVHPDDIKAAETQLALCFDGIRPDYECEFRMKHRDGHWVWILDRGRVLSRGDDGKPLMMFGTHLDMTARKQAEETIRASEARISLLGQMLDAAPASITIHDAEGRFLFANRVTATLHGYDDQEDFQGTNLRDLDVAECRVMMAERVRRIAEDGEARFEVTHLRKDGSTFPLEVLAKMIEWDRQPAILSIATDITERKQAEEALRQFKTMFDTANFGAALAGLDGRLFYVNARFAADHGFLSSELVGRPLACLHNEAQMPHVNQLLDDLHVSGLFGPAEVWHCHQDGTAFPMLMAGFVIRDATGTPECLAITAIDLRDRKSLEARLAQAQKMESVGRLAGGVAHDFNNMLGVILGYTEMARDRVAPDDPVSDYLREVFVAARRSADITQQLLAFARKQTIAPKVLGLDETVEGMLKMLRRLIGEDIDLLWLPEADWPVLMDPSQVHQILANLCVNARDAIGGVGKITIETHEVSIDAAYCATHEGFVLGDFVMLAVSDNGCGMDRKTLDNLFEPFFTTKDVSRGTGLGLATVYGIVKQNQGFINVYSELGQGTTFRIYLPAHRSPDDQAAPGVPETAPDASAGETVLLVEDEPAILSLTTRMLELLGYKVLTAGTPDHALGLAREYAEEIHLVMTDVVMPVMNGRELARRLSAIRPGLKWLFMSGYTADVIAHHGVLDEGVQFIQKPFGLHDLAARVRQALLDG